MSAVKLWLDDIRPAPDETWTWTKSADETIRYLSQCKTLHLTFEVAQLDHDLGGMAYNYCQTCRATLEDDKDAFQEVFVHGCEHMKTGRIVVEWMQQENYWPELVVIHSWNSEGARRMADICAAHATTFIRPFGQSISIRVQKL